jgi:DNA-binding CsgD family transcriptional regulator
MSDVIRIKDSHYFLTSASDVDTILHPLKTHLGVTSLVYQRNFTNGTEIRLSNQPAWIKHFFDQGYYRVSGFEKHPDYYQSGFLVWSSLTHHQPILNAAREFNIDHGMTLMQKTSDGVEYFFLGTTPDKPYVINLLLHNLEFLNRFTAYFKEQAATLIKKARENCILIPKKYEQVATSELGIPYQNTLQPLNPKKILKVKKFHFDNKKTLSEREITCAKLLLQGKSARMIAEELFLSPRTVETHLQHVKEKLNRHSKSELIAELIELKIHLL